MGNISKRIITLLSFLAFVVVSCLVDDTQQLLTTLSSRFDYHRRLAEIDTPHWYIWALLAASVLLPTISITRNLRSYIYITVVRKHTPPSAPENPHRRRDELHILAAAIEHTIPERNVKVSAGGLGKVLDQMLKEHPPGVLSLVHPMFGDIDYGKLEEFDTVYCVVDSKQVMVQVKTMESELNGIKRQWYLLEHDIFREQDSKAPYPSPMTQLRVLKYFSLWNQAVAELIAILQPDVYHCLDYHAALAPLYLPEHRQVPMILVLHNADYMGVIETDFISNKFWKTVKQMRRLTLLFNLSEQAIRDYMMFEGRFNMLRAGVQYILDTQDGRGICAVSANYAQELKRERPLFSSVPWIMALDNATDPSADAGHMSISELQKRRAMSKLNLQRSCDLNVSERYKILIFIGRWVKQKGVDQIALLTPTILRAHPDVQMVLVGPAGDSQGMYAQELLEPMSEEFPGRLAVKTTFFKMSADMRAGADYCFAPSISEPFGYVDVEFGLLGVPTIGCAVGGLSKMPGVYYRQQNSDSNEAILQSFYCAIEFALSLPEDVYWTMAAEGIKSEFPFDTWRENLQEAYTQALKHFEPSLGKSRPGALETMFAQGANFMSSVVGGAVVSQDHTKMGEVTGVVSDMRRMDIYDEAEFLTQDVSEQRTHTILRKSITRAGGDRKDAAALSFYIFQADQRQKETNKVTLWLMKPFKPLAANGRCITIHAVVALGFIFFPVGVSTMYDALDSVDSVEDRRFIQTLFYVGLGFGSLLWITLSNGIPPNLLMSASMFLNVILIYLTYSGLSQWSLFPISFFFGCQSASRLLFAIWNFGEDFQGGFETITKRIALWESLRICADGLLVFIASSGFPVLANLIRVIISLTVLGCMVAAPRAYSSFVLPTLGWLEGISNHLAYWFLLLSQAMFALAWAPGLVQMTWWNFGAWRASEMNLLILLSDVMTCITIFAAFMTIHSLTVWGPWPMRDFVCLVPPGSLLTGCTVFLLGAETLESRTLAACLFVGAILDAARVIAIFASMLVIVGSKWYALKAGFISFLVVGACTAAAPYITSVIAYHIRGGDPFAPVTGGEMIDNPTITFWAVVPFCMLSYLFQLLALPFFNEDIVTYKGHGMVLPNRTTCGAAATQHKVSVLRVSEKQREHDFPLLLPAGMSMDMSSFAVMSETEPVPDTGSMSLPGTGGGLPIGDSSRASLQPTISWRRSKPLQPFREEEHPMVRAGSASSLRSSLHGPESKPSAGSVTAPQREAMARAPKQKRGSLWRRGSSRSSMDRPTMSLNSRGSIRSSHSGSQRSSASRAPAGVPLGAASM